jgi:hypothetical protein
VYGFHLYIVLATLSFGILFALTRAKKKGEGNSNNF